MSISWEFIAGAILVAIVACVLIITVGYNNYVNYEKDHKYRMACVEKGGTYITGYDSGMCIGRQKNEVSK